MTPKSASRISARPMAGDGGQILRPGLDVSIAPRLRRSQGQGSLVRARGQGVPPSPQVPGPRTIPVRPSCSGNPSRRRARRAPALELQAWEVVCRIGVNLLFTAAALGGLYRLLPVQLAQHHRLQVLEHHIEILSARLSRLQEGVDRGMDPLQQQALIKERLNRVPPDQIQVRLVDPSTLVADKEKSVSPTWIGQFPQSPRRP